MVNISQNNALSRSVSKHKVSIVQKGRHFSWKNEEIEWLLKDKLAKSKMTSNLIGKGKLFMSYLSV